MQNVPCCGSCRTFLAARIEVVEKQYLKKKRYLKKIYQIIKKYIIFLINISYVVGLRSPELKLDTPPNPQRFYQPCGSVGESSLEPGLLSDWCEEWEAGRFKDWWDNDIPRDPDNFSGEPNEPKRFIIEPRLRRRKMSELK